MPDGPARFLEIEPGPPLGVGLRDYPQRTFALRPSSTVLLYTDGLVEDRTRPVDVGMEQLRVAARGVTDPEALCERVLAALGGGEGHDDTAMLAVALPD